MDNNRLVSTFSVNVLFKCLQNADYVKFAPRGSQLFPLQAVTYGMEITCHIRLHPLNVTIFITHKRNCLMGATPMTACHSSIIVMSLVYIIYSFH